MALEESVGGAGLVVTLVLAVAQVQEPGFVQSGAGARGNRASDKPLLCRI